jgi:excinuclease ABC subunit C
MSAEHVPEDVKKTDAPNVAATSRVRKTAPNTFDGLAFARTLGHVPGVYRMLGLADTLLYVGKAKNLKKRVESYFARPQLQPRLALLVASVQRMEVMLTRTEAEALLLEAQLIKSLKPRFNIDLKDDKSYPYVRLSTQDQFPRLSYYRGSKEVAGTLFGPFPTVWAVKETVESLQKLFLLRTCEDSVFAHRTRPCLQHQIKRCSAPCVNLIDAASYGAQVKHVQQFLTGKSQAIIQEIGKDMEAAAAELAFEKAARLRDQIAALRRVTANHFIAGEGGDLDVVAIKIEQGMAAVVVLFFRNGLNLGSKSFFPKLPTEATEADVLSSFLMQFYLEHPAPDELLLDRMLDDSEAIGTALGDAHGHKVKLVGNPRAERAQLVALAVRTVASALVSELAAKMTMQKRFDALQSLLGLAHMPNRIECFDISHTMGEATIASCVVFNQAGPLKTDYRRFSISGIVPGDDYAAMHQALTRRYKRIASGEEILPDVLLIDGGKGQLKQAIDALTALEIAPLPIMVGVAKGPARKSGFETLFVGADMREIWPGPDALGGHLIQHVRDEAHRFAIAGHRKARAKTREKSVLEDIDGIGPARRRAILKAFGGLRGVAKAGVDELMTVSGINKDLADRIYTAYRGKATQQAKVT